MYHILKKLMEMINKEEQEFAEYEYPVSNIEDDYLSVMVALLDAPVYENRTGVSARKIPPVTLQHDMEDGFPILNTKRVAWNVMKVELEGFIQGETSKKWYQDRNCHIWDEWANPKKVPYSKDNFQKMKEEDDLGKIYGYQWNSFNGINQLQSIINTLNTNPNDRRMVCSSWNVSELDEMALVPCHLLWQVTTRGEYLDLSWYQRSCDWFLGVPFNISSYGLLLHLLAKECGLKEGVLTGNFADVHLYTNHENQAIDQIERQAPIDAPIPFPKVETPKFNGIYNWTHKDTNLIGYNPAPAIKAPVAI
jgi:thymidylate synthase